MDLLQVAVTSVGAFVALFLLSKLMGHRQISELSVFDYVNGITIGSIAAEMATELEKPLRPLVAMVVWALLWQIFAAGPATRGVFRAIFRRQLVENDGKAFSSDTECDKMDA